MSLQNKSLNQNIDLSEAIIVTWKNKWKIFLITVIVLLIGIFSKINSKVSEKLFLAKTEILPISSFDNYQYSAFNTYLIKMEKNNNIIIPSTTDNELTLSSRYNNKLANFTSFSEYLNHIDQSYLYNLFLEKLNQKHLFKKGIKKFNLVKKENFSDNKSYENEVTKLASSIKISNVSSNYPHHIIFAIKSKKIWEEFLSYIEVSANYEIQKYLKNNFELFIINSEKIKQYVIEDITFEIENNLDNEFIKIELEKMKRRVEENKDVKRLKYLFENSPIVNSNNFIAARLNIPLTTYKSEGVESISMQKTIFLSILLGLVLGIIYVLIESKIKKILK